MYNNQKGFTHPFLILFFLIVLGAISFAGYRVYINNNSTKQNLTPQSDANKTADHEPVKWAYNEKSNEWYVQSGKAPSCKNPLKFDYSPVDISQVTSVLLPGQYRGFNYKPHGGFRLDGSQNGQVEVKMPMDAKITGLTRYIESPDMAMQYIVTFDNDCGIALKFDHLHVLSPRLQELAEKQPEAKLDDTRNSPSNAPEAELFRAGEVIATAIGHPKIKNFGFDFGVYDYRQRNEISKNTKWAALHNNYQASEWYGICWFDLLPGSDSARATQLSEVSTNTQKPNQVVSDYCPNARHSTLDINDGKPTEN